MTGIRLKHDLTGWEGVGRPEPQPTQRAGSWATAASPRGSQSLTARGGAAPAFRSSEALHASFPPPGGLAKAGLSVWQACPRRHRTRGGWNNRHAS